MLLLFAALILQDEGRELILAVAEAQVLTYSHRLSVGSHEFQAKVRYRVESVDRSRQHSGQYVGAGAGEFKFRSGTHG